MPSLRNWYEILGEGSQTNRPMVSQWTGGKEKRIPYYSPAEILGSLRDRFRAIDPTMTTDPVTGQKILTKTMPRFELPAEIGVGRLGESYFQRPESSASSGGGARFTMAGGYTPPTLHTFRQGGFTDTEEPAKEERPLDYRWILPKGAYEGPATLTRQPPSSDVERMGTGVGTFDSAAPNLSYANPSHYPGARFDIPTGTSPYAGYDFPVFGGVTNLASGEVSLPSLGGRGTPQERQYKMTSYGRFDPTVPQTSFRMGGITRKSTSRFRNPYGRQPQQNMSMQDLMRMQFPSGAPSGATVVTGGIPYRFPNF